MEYICSGLSQIKMHVFRVTRTYLDLLVVSKYFFRFSGIFFYVFWKEKYLSKQYAFQNA